jgi:hypothetical protein
MCIILRHSGRGHTRVHQGTPWQVPRTPVIERYLQLYSSEHLRNQYYLVLPSIPTEKEQERAEAQTGRC